jgi:hypothetical protein
MALSCVNGGSGGRSSLMVVSGFDMLAPTIADRTAIQNASHMPSGVPICEIGPTNREKEIYGHMNETDTVESTTPI